MAIPSPIKFTKNGVEYVSQVDRVNYTIKELTRAALRDTGKYVCRMTRKQIKRRTGKLAKNIQYWVRKRETDLLVGFKVGGFYGIFQELGAPERGIPKVGALRNAVYNNIEEIIKIQGMYLSAIEDENTALGYINESEEMGDGY
ncbi:MAG: hypothetical protein K0R07_174 [Sedimentibacter sp.]|nr:hypothetical protein [Sedimentibacter sp.]